MTSTLQLTEQLIARPSVTPDDALCQGLLAERLQALGFDCESIVSGPDNFRVSNLWALKKSANPNAKTLVFAGHTDVVPTGPLAQWHSDPFIPTQRGGRLYGRGAADMKTSIAAFVVAVEEFLAREPQPALNLALLLTSDEEGPAVDGTVVVCQALVARGQKLDYCIVGEPTSVERTGDMIKNGRRGTLSGKLVVNGVQGHIAYPHLARNPIHQLAPALAELVATVWDQGNAFFPPTSWQVSNVHGGTGASNVIPGEVDLTLDVRHEKDAVRQSVHASITRFAREIARRRRLKLDYRVVHETAAVKCSPELSELLGESVQRRQKMRLTLPSGAGHDAAMMARICPVAMLFIRCKGGVSHHPDESVKTGDVQIALDVMVDFLQALAEKAGTAGQSIRQTGRQSVKT